MQTNGNITIFNPFIIGHDTKYFGCKIWNVWAIYRARVDLDVNSEFNLSRLIVRVPVAQAVFSKRYVDPEKYDESDPDTNFTFIPGSIVALGIVDEPTATKDWLIRNCTAMQITKVNYNRYGILKANWHWKLEGI